MFKNSKVRSENNTNETGLSQSLCINDCMFTNVTDLQPDGEDGVGAGGVFIHQRASHCPVLPALLHDSFTFPYAVHREHGEVPHIHPTLRVLFQLAIQTV